MSRADLMKMARTMLVERGASGISHLTFTFGGSNPEIEIAEPLATERPGHSRPRRDRRWVLLGQPAVRVYGRPARRRARDLRDDGLHRGRRRRDAIPGTTHKEIFERALELHAERGGPTARDGSPILATTSAFETEERWLADSPRTSRSRLGWPSMSSSTRNSGGRPGRRRGDVHRRRIRPRAGHEAACGEIREISEHGRRDPLRGGVMGLGWWRPSPRRL